jgi:hypothetical protein
VTTVERWIVIDTAGGENDLHVLLVDGSWLALAQPRRRSMPAVQVFTTRAEAQTVIEMWPADRREGFGALRITSPDETVNASEGMQ